VYKIISIDEEKEFLTGYSPKKAGDFHIESAKNANKKFDQELKKITNKKVILMCGGSASGKTEFIAKFCPIETVEESEIVGVVFDSTLATESGAEVKIRNITKSGNIPVVCLILPYSLSRCLKAFHQRDRKIPESRFFETHYGARRVSLWIAKNYPDIEILIYYNRLIEEADKSDGDLKITKIEGGLGFVEISFENRSELIVFLEESQCSEEEIKTLIINGK
jgi:hypothetical protein